MHEVVSGTHAFNTCTLTNVFGHGAVKFNKKQLRELKRVYEIPMLLKLGLGNKCARMKQDWELDSFHRIR